MGILIKFKQIFGTGKDVVNPVSAAKQNETMFARLKRTLSNEDQDFYQ